MAVARVPFGVFATIAIIFYAMILPFAPGAHSSSAPAPSPSSDGTTIDQGIAYVLMLVALVLTYLIH